MARSRQRCGGAAGPGTPFCRVRGSPQGLDKLVQWLHQGLGVPAGIEGRHKGVGRAGLHTFGGRGDSQVEGVQHHAEGLVLSAQGLPIGQVPHDWVAEGAAVYS